MVAASRLAIKATTTACLPFIVGLLCLEKEKVASDESTRFATSDVRLR